MKLIIGLGNPGRTYAKNRHNVGFMCVSHFAREQGIELNKKQGKARIGTGEIAGSIIVVARPQTGMNLSGQSAELMVKKFNIEPDSLIVIHDDLDLPLGKIRLSYSAGSSGHKGVNSIISHLKSHEFTRLRVGIGRPNNRTTEADIIAYVLGNFTPGEKEIINQVIPRVNNAILCLLTEGLSAAMNNYN